MIFDKFLRFDIPFPPMFTLFLGVSDNPIPPIPIPSDLISSYPYPLSFTLTTLIRSIMDNIYMNNQFNLNNLRSDASQYVAAQIISPIYNDRKFWLSDLKDQDQINITDFIHLVDFVIAALIGDFMFMAMYDDPALSFTTFDLGLSYPGDPAY